MKILIAPDKFKFALDASSAAAAIAAGIRDILPAADLELCPLADGGEGSGPLLAGAFDADQHAAEVSDAMGRKRVVRWWRTPDGATAVIESAEAVGLSLLEPALRNPLRTSSHGVGELVRMAADSGCRAALVCVGGSATIDGGAGCVQALGYEYLDNHGRVLDGPMSGGHLHLIRELRLAQALPTMLLKVLCDVSNPLLGVRGAARVFGPQKGATPDDIELLERGLTAWAELLRVSTRRDVRTLPGGGAAGGLPAGLYAACRARLVQGFAEIAGAVKLRERLSGCDLCITGEGRIDSQTSAGKVVAGVAEMAAKCGVPVVALVGAVEPPARCTLEAFARHLGLSHLVTITPADMPIEEALRTTSVNLRSAAAAVVSG